MVYYNENDPYAAEWLRNLILLGEIAQGEVDDRSIFDVGISDLRGFAQCHFFAGIGVWSHALRLAGWSDDREVWTGSCPCQPFSAAGKRGGVEDERHLWPEFFRLIAQHRPRTVFGEQVASKGGLAWLDIVSTDMERTGYAIGTLDTCAAGFGAPHIRQRLYFVADAQRRATERHGLTLDGETRGVQGEAHKRERLRDDIGDGIDARSLADSAREREHRSGNGRPGRRGEPSDSSALDHTTDSRREGAREHGSRSPLLAARPEQPSATNGFWRDADWLPCIDGKARPVEPGTFPLAHGAPARVGRLRAYGNAICAPQAAEFIKAYMTC